MKNTLAEIRLPTSQSPHWGMPLAAVLTAGTVLASCFGCSGDSNDAIGDTAPSVSAQPGATPPTTSGTPGVIPAASCATNLTLSEGNNYSFRNTLQIEMTTLKDATDLTFDWSELTTDFFGKPINPYADVKLVMLSLWGLTPDLLVDNLSHDNLPRSDNKGAITTYPDGTYASMNLLGFDILGEPLPEQDLWRVFDTGQPDYQFPSDAYTFLAMVSESKELGRGARMLSMFNINPSSTQTELKITDNSTKLEFDAQLQQAIPVTIPAGTPGVTIDWSQMKTNALGNPFIPSQVTKVVVAHYTGVTLAQLEQEFLDLEELADGWWSSEVKIGTSLDLSTLVDETTAAPFAGIDGNGVWLAALFCTKNCDNPAPWSITVLQPCAQ